MPRTRHPLLCAELLSPNRVNGFHNLFIPAGAELAELRELKELVGDPGAILVDGRLVVVTHSAGGGDLGGFAV